MGYAIDAEHPHPTLPFKREGLLREKVSGEPQFGSDGFQHAVHVGQHIMVPEPHHPIAMRFDRAGSCGIGVAGRVLSAVQFDDQLSAATCEVGNMRTDRKLSDEFAAVDLTGAQSRPQRFFRLGRVAAQFARHAGQSLFDHKSPFPAGERDRVRGHRRQFDGRPCTLIQLRLSGFAAKPAYPSPSREKVWSNHA